MSNEGESSKETKTAGKPGVLKENIQDPLIAESIFPDAAAIFTSKARPLSEIKDTAQIVLDTHALLVPYGIGGQTLAQIETTYKRLLQEERLNVPAQVAREFARNRVAKLSELFQKLSRKRSQLPTFVEGAYPMLGAMEEYRELQTLERELDRLVVDYRSRLKKVLDHIKAWEWNDPVSLLYGRLFTASIVVEAGKGRDEIKAEHVQRFAHKIPPGYKDQAKDDGGIGDFLIWLSILKVGAERKKSVIFVTGEEKADWWHRIEGQSLYPRFELVDEFRRHSGDQSFHIIKFSELLELFGASGTAVAEIKKEEIAQARPSVASQEAQRDGFLAEQAVARWLVSQGYVVTEVMSDVDYLVDADGSRYAVDVVYAPPGRSSRLRRRLEDRAIRYRDGRAHGCPIVVVVVSPDATTLNVAEHYWKKLNPSLRLGTGLLGSDGSLLLVRGLEMP